QRGQSIVRSGIRCVNCEHLRSHFRSASVIHGMISNDALALFRPPFRRPRQGSGGPALYCGRGIPPINKGESPNEIQMGSCQLTGYWRGPEEREIMEPTSTQGDGFAELLRAEWAKFRAVPGRVIGIVVAALVVTLLGLLAASGIHCDGPNGNAPLSVP